ncbi:MAG: DUF3052 domain-containing protein [Caulobacteraceae bacterium]|nr:DUF3052 domain-containing protein [Caulobacteraceae bacterium]
MSRSPAPAGYSGKSVIAKIGLKPGQTLAVVDAPPHIDDLAAPLPEGARMVTHFDPDAAVVWAFVRERSALEAAAPTITGAAPGAMLWISWPKKASRLFRDLTEDGVRAVLLPTGWVDVKVCAVDADWSGLKFLRRKP